MAFAVSHWRGLLASQLLIPKMSPPSMPKWRNGRRAGFKIPYPSLGVWVRLPPSALFASVITDSQTCSEPRLFRGFRISGGGCSEALLASEEFSAVVRAFLRFSDFRNTFAEWSDRHVERNGDRFRGRKPIELMHTVRTAKDTQLSVSIFRPPFSASQRAFQQNRSELAKNGRRKMNHYNNSHSLRTTNSALNPNETKSNFSRLKCYKIGGNGSRPSIKPNPPSEA